MTNLQLLELILLIQTMLNTVERLWIIGASMSKAIKKSQLTIGPYTLIEFPSVGINGVPAKVDTGADSSSIWASHVKEKNGRLSFTLFGPSSPLYNGKKIVTSDYQVRSFKNSFGQTELRYKVRLRTVVEGRIIRARFSLADRSNNRFPVLVGRSTLHGRFVVDVTRFKRRGEYEVLVLNSGRLKTVAKFFDNISARNKKFKFTLANFDDLIFLIDKQNMQIKIASLDKDLREFDIVYFKSILADRALASAVAQYLQLKSVPFFDRATLEYQPKNKLEQYIILQSLGLNIPKSILVGSAQLSTAYAQLAEELGLPFVMKDISSNRGNNNFLIKDKKDYKKLLKLNKKRSANFISQRFIANDGDYRVLIFGKQIKLVMHRVNTKADSHLNNVSKGSAATLMKETIIPGKIRRQSIKAAEVLNLNIAGVDLIQDKRTGAWYCLEVNDGPQLATGSFVAEKEKIFTEYLEARARKTLKI